ncbi:hypothetical protein [Streptomyces sp. NPDC127108]|uniref:hypothetical protein n=1 Tax=Streptomyces sp. NPDC127108 TaxID=3345361 RepID=UPI003632E887
MRNPTEFGLYELDIATGELTAVAQKPGQAAGRLHTPTGELYSRTLTADGDIELAQRRPDPAGTARPTASSPGTSAGGRNRSSGRR